MEILKTRFVQPHTLCLYGFAQPVLRLLEQTQYHDDLSNRISDTYADGQQAFS